MLLAATFAPATLLVGTAILSGLGTVAPTALASPLIATVALISACYVGYASLAADSGADGWARAFGHALGHASGHTLGHRDRQLEADPGSASAHGRRGHPSGGHPSGGHPSDGQAMQPAAGVDLQPGDDANRAIGDCPPRERASTAAVPFEQFRDRVSHELRTPLNAVIGFSEVMQCELLGPVGNERYREYAAHIRQSALDFQNATEKTLELAALMAAPAAHESVPTPFSVVLPARLPAPPAEMAQSSTINCHAAGIRQALNHLVDAVEQLSATSAAAVWSADYRGGTNGDRMLIEIKVARLPPDIETGTTGAQSGLCWDPATALPGFELNLLLAHTKLHAAGGSLHVHHQPESDHWCAHVSLACAPGGVAGGAAD